MVLLLFILTAQRRRGNGNGKGYGAASLAAFKEHQGRYGISSPVSTMVMIDEIMHKSSQTDFDIATVHACDDSHNLCLSARKSRISTGMLE